MCNDANFYFEAIPQFICELLSDTLAVDGKADRYRRHCVFLYGIELSE